MGDLKSAVQRCWDDDADADADAETTVKRCMCAEIKSAFTVR